MDGWFKGLAGGGKAGGGRRRAGRATDGRGGLRGLAGKLDFIIFGRGCREDQGGAGIRGAPGKLTGFMLTKPPPKIKHASS